MWIENVEGGTKITEQKLKIMVKVGVHKKFRKTKEVKLTKTTK